jgi:type I restriction enzyme S subunit
MSFPSSVELPNHWRVMALKRFCDVRDGTHETPSYVDETDDAFPLLTSKDISDGEIRFDEAKYISAADFADISRRSNVELGDIVMPMIGSVGGAVSVETDRPFGIKNIALFKKSEGFCARWLQLLIDSDLTKYQFDLMQSGGVQGFVSLTTLRNLVMPFPPLDEQRAISSFLDVETSKIDGLVSEQRRLVELLKEKRQAVISHAVTKGLNPNAPMKPSGIQWLGEVPEHWKVVSLKRVAKVNTGVAKGKDHIGKETINVPYLRVANVQDGYLDLETVTTIHILKHELERYRLVAGDVLMNEGGDFDKLGRGHIWEGQIDPCITQNHVFAVRPTAVQSQWLNRITSSDYAQFYFMTRSKQSTNLASISSTNLMQLPVVLPPECEQNEILAFIDESAVKFDGLLAESERAIDLLQERRTALISAAVTGKIDVRQFTSKDKACVKIQTPSTAGHVG